MRNAMRVLCVALVAIGGGCSDNGDSRGDAAASAPDMSPAPDLMTATVLVRLAHLSPDAAPIDVCVSKHGAHTWTGPVLKTAGVNDTGLAYGQVTNYLEVPAGQYDVRIIDGAATSCAIAQLDVTDLPALPGDASITIAALGFVHPPMGNGNTFRLHAYTDDTTVASTSVALRFIHASPDTPRADIGTDTGTDFKPLFVNVAFTQVGASTSPASDANGYITLAPFTTPPTLTLRATGTTSDTLVVTPKTAPPAGTVATLFAIGDVTGNPKPLQALICLDNAEEPGALASCSALP